jgi:hypothetical protein
VAYYYNAKYSHDNIAEYNNKNDDDSQIQLPAKWNFFALSRLEQIIVKIQ